jgi:hypothetical protein
MTAVTNSFNAMLPPRKPRFNRMVRRGFGSYLKQELAEDSQLVVGDYSTLEETGQ